MAASGEGETTAERVVALLNEAQLKESKQEKIKLLQQVQELIVHKDLALLDNFVEEMLQFTQDPEKDVRRFLVTFIEEACKVDSGLTERAVACYAYMLRDEAPAVVKRVVQAVTNMYMRVLSLVARQPKLNQAPVLWSTVDVAKGEILSLLHSTTNDGVRLGCLRFLESIILAHSLRTTESDRKGQREVSLDVVPLSHPFLDVEQLRSEGRELFDRLCDLLSAENMSVTALAAAITSLANIARMRPTFMARVIARLCELFRSPPAHLKPTQVASLNHSIKINLLSIMKHEASAEHHDVLVPVLEDIGADPVAISELDQRGQRRGRQAAGAKRAAESDAASAAKRLRALNAELLERICELPDLVVADLVMSSLLRLPDIIPPSFLETPSDSAANAAAKDSSERDDGPAAAVSSSPTAASRGTSAAAAAKRKSSASVAMPAPSALQIARRVQRKPFELRAKPLAADEAGRLIQGAFRRLLDVEGQLTESGAARTRVVLIARLASQLMRRDSSDALTPMLVEFILENVRSRAELALVWLYHVYERTDAFRESAKTDVQKPKAMDESGDGEGAAAPVAAADELPVAAYENCVTLFVKGLRGKIDPRDLLFSRIILELPAIPTDALLLVQELSRTAEYMLLGLTTLRDVVVQRPLARDRALALLLQLTHDSDDRDLCDRAIRFCQKLYRETQLGSAIEEYALERAQSLTCETQPDGTDWTSPVVERQLSLLYMLLGEKHEHLLTLQELYTKVPDMAKSVIVRTIIKPVSAVGIDAPIISKLVAGISAGSERLVLRILFVLSEKSAPPMEIVAALRGGFDRGELDAHFLIPILSSITKREIIKALPKLLLLPVGAVNELFNRLLGSYGSSSQIGNSPLTPSELMIALHNIKIKENKALLMPVIKATNMCFDRKRIYSQEVLAVVLQHLVDQNPLPPLLMRTVIQSLQNCPRLKTFVVNILARLVTREVWQDEDIWKGFRKCCTMTRPQSFQVLLQLPKAQRDDVLANEKTLCKPFEAYVASLPADHRAALGLDDKGENGGDHGDAGDGEA